MKIFFQNNIIELSFDYNKLNDPGIIIKLDGFKKYSIIRFCDLFHHTKLKRKFNFCGNPIIMYNNTYLFIDLNMLDFTICFSICSLFDRFTKEKDVEFIQFDLNQIFKELNIVEYWQKYQLERL